MHFSGLKTTDSGWKGFTQLEEGSKDIADI